MKNTIKKEDIELVNAAYNSGDMFSVYDEFVRIDTDRTTRIVKKTIKNSSLAKELKIRSIDSFFKSFENGNEDIDELFLDIIQALDEEYNTGIYE